MKNVLRFFLSMNILFGIFTLSRADIFEPDEAIGTTDETSILGGVAGEASPGSIKMAPQEGDSRPAVLPIDFGPDEEFESVQGKRVGIGESQYLRGVAQEAKPESMGLLQTEKEPLIASQGVKISSTSKTPQAQPTKTMEYVSKLPPSGKVFLGEFGFIERPVAQSALYKKHKDALLKNITALEKQRAERGAQLDEKGQTELKKRLDALGTLITEEAKVDLTSRIDALAAPLSNQEKIRLNIQAKETQRGGKARQKQKKGTGTKGKGR